MFLYELLEAKLILKFFFVEDIFAKAGTNTAQVGDVIGVFLDRSNLNNKKRVKSLILIRLMIAYLFIEKFRFQIIRKVRITREEKRTMKMNGECQASRTCVCKRSRVIPAGIGRHPSPIAMLFREPREAKPNFV